MSPADVLSRLRAELKSGSPVFRHAVRAALATAAAFAAARWLGLSHEMWVIVSVVVVMRPSLGGTLRLSRDRVIGTALGALAGMAVILLTGAQGLFFYVLLLASFFLTMFLHVFHHLSFVALLSFTIVLGLGIVFPEGWKLGMERIVDTLLGAGLGLGAAFLIWPNRARKTIRQRLSEALTDFGSLFHILGESYVTGDVRAQEIINARRKTFDSVGACREIFAEASAEPGLSAAQREDLTRLSKVMDRLYDLLMSMDTVVRRVSGEGPPEVLAADLRVLLGEVDRLFAWMSEYSLDQAGDRPMPDASAAVAEMFDRIRIVRAEGRLEEHTMERRTNLSAFLYHVHAVVLELNRGFERLDSYRHGGRG